MAWIRRTAGCLIATLTLAGAASLPAGAEVSAASAINDDPAFLQVYVNNIENLETVDAVECPGDWQDLIWYMKSYETSPDLFLVQQLAGRGELNTLLDFMNEKVPGTYAGVLAVPEPEQMASPCRDEKDHQTNAIIYRTGRFDLLDTATWQSDDLNAAGGCDNNSQDRTVNIRAKLWDKVARRQVTAASIHWPTSGVGGGAACATENAREAAEQMAVWNSALRIWGGDGNVTDLASDSTWRTWYARTNGDLGGTHGYRDAIYDHCGESGAPIKPCVRDNWTVGGDNRIDFLFARKATGMPFVGAEHTVTFDEGDAADIQFTGADRQDRSYSDHRAVRARIHY